MKIGGISMENVIWLSLIIVFLIIEIITVGLTSIWLAGGALVALILNCFGVNVVWQIVAFFIVSIILMIFTRPFAKKYINSGRTKTNYESVIGKTAKVTETIDNLNETGSAIVDGQEWTARAKNPVGIIEKNEIVKITDIVGVKLIVEKLEK